MFYIPTKEEMPKGMTTLEKCMYLDEIRKENPDMEKIADSFKEGDKEYFRTGEDGQGDRSGQ